MHDVRTRFKQVWYRLDNLVGQYAKNMGINITTLFILELLAEEGELYTQKILCEKLMLPKQLVNSVIKVFWEQGYVELKEAKDRRHKNIGLTPKGKAYAESILTPFHSADERAWDTFTDAELITITGALEKYEKAMEENLRH
ncbi:MAG: MarR family winged helix-turn-helix transcriptional regulator [Defluviitaleaceae bacterium]|nr:MarR family winged helix-turn-helix transcriptional regulator [Defluviitaleaceae bacterium]